MIKLIVQILDDVLRLNRGEFFFCHVTAVAQPLLQRIQRPNEAAVEPAPNESTVLIMKAPPPEPAPVTGATVKSYAWESRFLWRGSPPVSRRCFARWLE